METQTHSLDISRDRLHEMLKTAIGEQIVGYLNDEMVTNICVNSDGKVWVEKFGESMTYCGQIPTTSTMMVIKLVAGSVKAQCNEESPSIAAELVLDGSRFQGMIPPVTPGPSFSLRIKARRIIPLEDYVEHGIITRAQKENLIQFIKDKKNILVAGGTNSGKTTFINALINEIKLINEQDGISERLILIEDTHELQCAAPNHEFFHTTAKYNQDMLLKDALRYYPHRILVGEIRGVEALTFLDALNTGHPGAITSIHASSAKRALRRMEQLIRRAVPGGVQREEIADAVDVIVFLEAGRDGRRRVKEILEMVDYKNDDYVLKEII